MPARFTYATYPLLNSIMIQQNTLYNIDNSRSNTLRAALYGTGPAPGWINLTGSYPEHDKSFAVLMAGQTPELDQALDNDFRAGIQGFWSAVDEIHVWYIRRRIGSIVKHTETVAVIMPCYAFLRPRQVAGVYETRPNQIGAYQATWGFLYQTPSEGAPGYQGLPLQHLRTLLGGLHGTEAWL